MLAALPKDTVLSLEIPRLTKPQESPRYRAEKALATTRSLLPSQT